MNNDDRFIPLIETYDGLTDYEIYKEEDENKKPVWRMKGIYLQGEIWNKNKRWYQIQELLSETEKFNKHIIPRKAAIGELDHSTASKPLFSRMSHIFDRPLVQDGNNIIGDARVLEKSVYGQNLAVICEEGIPFGVSSKGFGKTSKYSKGNQSGKLVSNFLMVIPGDVVYSQSAPDAIPETFFEMVMDNDERMKEIYSENLLERFIKQANVGGHVNIQTKRELFKSLVESEIDERIEKG